MRLTVADIEAISRTLARQYAGELTVDAVAVTHGDTNHVELLVTVSGCHNEPCMVMVSVSRTDRQSMERELRVNFAEALHKHRA